MTSPTSPSATPTPDPNRPEAADVGALFDAVATEHATIYGYGIVSAYALSTRNELVSDALAEHRARREAALEMLKARGVTVPLPAAGYQLPMRVDNPTAAAKLAARMEDDCAVAWRAVLEQATTESDRAFGLTALTQCAVLSARWRRVLREWPVTKAFPGGSE